jgi:hypothetical protein
MVFRIVVGVVAGVIAGVVAGVVAGGDEVYQHHSSAWVVAGGVRAPLNARGTLLPSRSLEESVLPSMRVDRFFLRVEEKNPASPWRPSLESANLALARVHGFPPPADEEPASSMKR